MDFTKDILYLGSAKPSSGGGGGSGEVLVDNKTIIKSSNKLTLKGYSSATQGQMLVKDITNGTSWIDPLSDEELQEAVEQAETYKTQAGNYAATCIEKAEEINKKIWIGTKAEYEALTTKSDSTLYFIRD